MSACGRLSGTAGDSSPSPQASPPPDSVQAQGVQGAAGGLPGGTGGTLGGSGATPGPARNSQQVQKAMQAAGLPADGALVGLVMDYLRGQQVRLRSGIVGSLHTALPGFLRVWPLESCGALMSLSWMRFMAHAAAQSSGTPETDTAAAWFWQAPEASHARDPAGCRCDGHCQARITGETGCRMWGPSRPQQRPSQTEAWTPSTCRA